MKRRGTLTELVTLSLSVLGTLLMTTLATLGQILLVGTLLGLLVMWLWNWLCPSIFGLPEIGFWKAIGLYLLSYYLFQNKR